MYRAGTFEVGYSCVSAAKIIVRAKDFCANEEKVGAKDFSPERRKR